MGVQYTEAVDYLYGLGRFGTRPGLHRMIRILEALGNPHHGLRVIHTAGTNGKGSVCCFMAEILQAAGYRVGLYSSPHLQSIRERIRISGDLIHRRDFSETVSRVKSMVDDEVAAGREHATYFEILTAVMFDLFSRSDLDVAVLEVGLGGRFDATNVVGPPELSVITGIDLDHTEVLGDTIDGIAREKAGIIKRGSRAVVSSQNQEAVPVFVEICCQRRVPLTVLRDEESPGWVPRYLDARVQADGGLFSYVGNDWRIPDVEISMLGHHQIHNAALALAAAEQLQRQSCSMHIGVSDVRRGLSAARWPGRLEKVLDAPRVYLDGAHNEAGMRVLASTLSRLFAHRRIHGVIGMLRGRHPDEMLTPLGNVLNGTAVVTSAASPRSLELDALQEAADRCLSADCVLVRSDVNEAIDLCLDRAQPQDVVVIGGSLYLVGAARQRWRPVQ